MSLFLFKPHVVGSQDNITTPDVIVDHVYLDGALKPVHLLTCDTYLQSAPGETVRPAFVITALGGGALIGPAAVLSSGSICLARKAWRLNNLDGHVADVTLNSAPLASLTMPSDLIEQVGGTGDTLPRGIQLICTAKEASTVVEMHDPKRQRRLTHKVMLEPMSQDRWQGHRPRPRYSVGPMMKDVPHFL